jgi:hypothetical protein
MARAPRARPSPFGLPCWYSHTDRPRRGGIVLGRRRGLCAWPLAALVVAAARMGDTGGVPRLPRPPSRALPTSPFVRQEQVPPSTAGLAVGDRVTLDSWGMGRVTEVTTEYVVVDFRGAGLRNIPEGTKGFYAL